VTSCICAKVDISICWLCVLLQSQPAPEAAQQPDKGVKLASADERPAAASVFILETAAAAVGVILKRAAAAVRVILKRAAAAVGVVLKRAAAAVRVIGLKPSAPSDESKAVIRCTGK
jgi:hypothetical protein